MDLLMNKKAITPNDIEIAYYGLAHTLNTTDSKEELMTSIKNALNTILNCLNNFVIVNNFMIYNILLISRVYVQKNKKKYFYQKSFQDIITLLNLINYKQNSLETAPKR